MPIPTSLLLITSCLLAGDAKDGKPANKPRFTIGKETTYLLGPKDEAGHIDYFAALNERFKKGVTAETNAVVLLVQAFKPTKDEAGMPIAYYNLLGIDKPPEKGDYFLERWRFMKDRFKDNPEKEQETLWSETVRANLPWKGADLPHFARWLQSNEKPLALVVEASKRPDYFSPLLGNELLWPKKNGFGLERISFPTMKFVDAGEALCMRAMLRVGEGRTEDAWEDLLACHRLGRLAMRECTTYGALTGLWLSNLAADASLRFLDGARVDAKLIRNCLGDLQALPPIPSFVRQVDVSQRFMFLDAVLKIDRKGLTHLGEWIRLNDNRVPDFLARVALAGIDLDTALKKANRFHDRLVAAMREKDHRIRDKQIAEIDNEIESLSDPKMVTSLFFGGKSGKERGEILGDILLSLLVPAVAKVSQAEFRAKQHQHNLQVAFALEAFRKDQGRYPKNLDDLTPKYLKTIPGDVFSGKDLIYRPEEKGYLLYSVGPNLKDEGGRYFEYDLDPPGDDPRVRMPLPKVEGR